MKEIDLYDNNADPYDGEATLEPLLRTGMRQRVSGPIKKPWKVPKSWGYELIYTNNDLYCCKMLVIDPNSQTSMHLHLEKEETLLVVSGKLLVKYIDRKKRKGYIVKEGEAFTIAPGFPHALVALDEQVKLVEASTPSYDTDSIRIE
jgi:mannose-6-phosphate isomerase-like protein (cupin superfamily)